MGGVNSTSTERTVEMKAEVFLQRKNDLDLDDEIAEAGDAVADLSRQGIFFQLVSSDHIDPQTGHGKLSAKAQLEGWPSHVVDFTADEGNYYNVTFKVGASFGKPGAILVENHHPSEFYLRNLTLHCDDTTTLKFPCNSWVYHRRYYEGVPRIFFTNEAYLLHQTPPGILHFRKLELVQLCGNGEGERQKHDRIYDYDVYNDLGDPEKDNNNYSRPILGGSEDFPYPRRCRTGRAKSQSDPKSEIPLQLTDFYYIPRDEIFPRIKNSDFLASTIKSFLHSVLPNIINTIENDEEFNGIKDIQDLYNKGLEVQIKSLPSLTGAEKETKFKNPLEIIQQLFETDQTNPSLIKFPKPQLIQENDRNWLEDDEFARQMLAGLNPMVIQRITEFPLVSNLDPEKYGDRKSRITEQHLEPNLDGLTVEEAMKENRLYVVDYHDIFLPYLEKINALKGKGYASRTVFFLSKKGVLKTIAIELSLPTNVKTKGLKTSRVFTPQSHATKHGSYWELAKTHVSINDAAVHQLVSHWLRTHCSIEPFIIATHRQLSVMHPIHILLVPHFKNTLNINALARKALINADTGSLGAIIEKNFFAGKYSMELSSMAYKSWRFDEQGLPADLLKRGMAMEDPTMKHGLKLLIEDYPYAVDGLEIWYAIKEWVMDYINIFYTSKEDMLNDVELHNWWREVREVGHADKKEGWIDITMGLDALGEVLTIIIWLASAHHAAVNFGQYAYAGYMPNRPTNGRKLIPEDDDDEDTHLLSSNPGLFFLKAISSRTQAVSVMGVLEILSTHATDEEYLGQRNADFLTSNSKVVDAFDRFKNHIDEIEKSITSRNKEPSLFHRRGTVDIPYTLLYPSSKEGMSGQGIPNSTSI